METLGDALEEGIEIELRCQRPTRIGTQKVGRCHHSLRLHLPTLIATRGLAFPVALLQSRLKCPRCGDRRVLVMFLGDRKPGAAALGR